METHLSQSPPHLPSILAVVIFFFFILPPSLCDEHEACDLPFECGPIRNVLYPFFGDNRPQFCGHVGFQLTCETGSVLILEFKSLKYRVLNISRNSYIVRLARTDLWDDACPAENLVNTDLDYNLFSYHHTVKNLSLFYDCTKPDPSQQLKNEFGCPIEGRESAAFYINQPEGIECEVSIKVPVLQTLLSDLTIDTVKLKDVVNGGFDVEYQAERTACSECENSGGICGSNVTTHKFVCYCHDGSHPFQCPRPVAGNRRDFKLKLVIGVAAVPIGIVLICVIICFRGNSSSVRSMTIFRKITKNDQDLEAFIKNYGPLAPIRYRFSDVKKMTNSFKDKLGHGGFGAVYKGKLLDDRLVAVKVLNASKGNGQDFINEVASISRTSHVNIVNLVGFCLEGDHRALVFEFMPNGSLEKYIYKEKATQQLGWEKLYQIVIGIARGLEYLHRGCNTRILHFDIKPHNILLDENFNPKISDFGLAKLCTKKESIISMVEARGTIGYIAPEVISRSFGEVSHKSDVYSYGMMVLEMVGGRKNVDVGVSHTSKIYFPHWIYRRLELGNDFELQDVISIDESEIVKKMVVVGLWCIQTNPLDRPSMSKVTEMLEGSMEALQIPPKPYLSSPSRSPSPSHSTTTAMS